MVLKFKIDAGDLEVRGLEASFSALGKFAESIRDSQESVEKYKDSINESLSLAEQILNLSNETNIISNETANNSGKFASSANVAGRLFSGLARDAKGLAEQLGRASISLISIASVTGAIGALIGLGGSLFGIDNLALSAARARKTVAGLGVGYGAYQSFGVNFGRYIDPANLLGNVSGSVYDATSDSRTALLSAGVRQGGDATSQAADLLARLPVLFAGTPEGMIGPRANALGLTNILSVQEIARYLHASPKERDDQLAHFRNDSRTLDLSPEVLEKWSRFTTAVERAEYKIEAILGNKLSSLAGPIEKVSDGLVTITEAFLGSKLITDGLKTVNDGLTYFATKIGSPEFSNSINKFMSGFEAIIPIVKKIFDAVAISAKAGWYGFKFLNQDASHPYSVSGLIEDVFGHNTTGSERPGRLPTHGTFQGVDRPMTTGTHDLSGLPSAQNSIPSVSPVEGETQDQLVARIQTIYPTFSNQECVELASKTAGIGGSVTQWRRGDSATATRLPIGTPIATFLDRAGNPSTRYDGGQGIGISGNNTTHAAVIAGYTKDGILVEEQYVGPGGSPHLQEYKIGDTRGGEKDANNYFAINDRKGLPAGSNNPHREEILRAIAKRENSNLPIPEDPSIRARRRASAGKDVSYLETLKGAKTPKRIYIKNESMNASIFAHDSTVYG